ncbi:hypothetical protein ACWF94_00445 [Streptomyces sp. NPDC055078]
MTDAENLLADVVHGSPIPPRERNTRAWPAVETWFTSGETFLRQARLSAPHRRPALAVSAPFRSLAAACPTHRSR